MLNSKNDFFVFKNKFLNTDNKLTSVREGINTFKKYLNKILKILILSVYKSTKFQVDAKLKLFEKLMLLISDFEINHSIHMKAMNYKSTNSLLNIISFMTSQVLSDQIETKNVIKNKLGKYIVQKYINKNKDFDFKNTSRKLWSSIKIDILNNIKTQKRKSILKNTLFSFGKNNMELFNTFVGCVHKYSITGVSDKKAKKSNDRNLLLAVKQIKIYFKDQENNFSKSILFKDHANNMTNIPIDYLGLIDFLLSVIINSNYTKVIKASTSVLLMIIKRFEFEKKILEMYSQRVSEFKTSQSIFCNQLQEKIKELTTLINIENNKNELIRDFGIVEEDNNSSIKIRLSNYPKYNKVCTTITDLITIIININRLDFILRFKINEANFGLCVFINEFLQNIDVSNFQCRNEIFELLMNYIYEFIQISNISVTQLFLTLKFSHLFNKILFEFDFKDSFDNISDSSKQNQYVLLNKSIDILLFFFDSAKTRVKELKIEKLIDIDLLHSKLVKTTETTKDGFDSIDQREIDLNTKFKILINCLLYNRKIEPMNSSLSYAEIQFGCYLLDIYFQRPKDSLILTIQDKNNLVNTLKQINIQERTMYLIQGFDDLKINSMFFNRRSVGFIFKAVNFLPNQIAIMVLFVLLNIYMTFFNVVTVVVNSALFKFTNNSYLNIIISQVLYYLLIFLQVLDLLKYIFIDFKIKFYCYWNNWLKKEISHNNDIERELSKYKSIEMVYNLVLKDSKTLINLIHLKHRVKDTENKKFNVKMIFFFESLKNVFLNFQFL